jgi:hypothetical protein
MSSAKRLTQRKLATVTEVSQGYYKAVELYLTWFFPAVEMKASQRLHQAPSIDVDAEDAEEDEEDEGKNLNEKIIITY